MKIRRFTFVIIVIMFNLSIAETTVEAKEGDQTQTLSAVEVFVPGTNGGVGGNYTNPRVLLNPGDAILIESLGGVVDFEADEHIDDACGYFVSPEGLSRAIYDNPSNSLFCFNGEVGAIPPLPDPINSFGHAGLFLPSQPGTGIQSIGNGSASFTYSGASPQYLKLGINDQRWYNNDGQFRVRVTITRKSLAFTAESFSVDENAGSATISVSRTDNASSASVSYATSDGSATAGQDYSATSGVLNFAIGETTKTFNIPITNDTATESNETVNISLSAPTNGFILGVLQTSVLAINDNDTTNNNSAFVTQNVPPQMYAGEQYDVMVAFKNTGTTTWAAGSYGISSQNPLDNTTWGINRAFLQSSIAPGATAFVSFTVTAPTTPGSYNFQWKTWQQGVAHFGAFSPNKSVEVLPKPIANVTDATITEGDSGQRQLTFIITLSAPMIDQGFIDVATANGTAVAGQDYVAAGPRLIFAEGQTSFPVKIDVTGDTAFEPNETFFLNLQNSFHIAIADAQAKAVINDNERRKIADADRDGKSDFWVFRPSNGVWYGLSSLNNNSFFAVHFGQQDDIPAGGDYDGDGYPDYAVWRPSTGVWYVYRTTDAQFTAYQFGLPADIPTQGDFDGDRKADFAVFRPSTGIWYIRYSQSGVFGFHQFGLNGDVPIKADFDGDGKNDIGVFRPSTGFWYVRKSSDSQLIIVKFGTAADKVAAADYDGDGKADIAVWRPSTGVWYYLRSTDNYTSYSAFQFGLSGDIPSPGDFDGDGKDDFAVFRPSTGIWYVWKSSTNSLLANQFGTSGDIPVASRWIQ